MEAVHRYEGTVNQVMGDGIMALFGAPLAHEDHAVRACYAALRMQDAIRRYTEELRRTHGLEVQIRVGMNSGDVVVRSIGSDLRMDYTAVGQTTHLAARMEQLAPPGATRLTAETLRLRRGLRARPPARTDPRQGRQRACRGLRAGRRGRRTHAAAGGAARGFTRFVGRDAEMEQIRQAAEQARAGRGQLVAVVGEPGVGKSTALLRVHPFASRAPTAGWRCSRRAPSPTARRRRSCRSPICSRGYFRIDDRDDYAQRPRQDHGHAAHARRRARGAVPAVLWLLDVLDAGRPVPRPRAAAAPPARRWRRQAPAAAREPGAAAAARLRGPALGRRRDPGLARRPRREPADGAAASRRQLPARVSARMGAARRTTGSSASIRCRPRAPTQLLATLLGDDPSAAPLKAPAHRAHRGQSALPRGERADAGRDRRARRRARRLSLVRDAASIQVPATVQAILAARIDRLPPELKRLLQAAAVVGKDVPVPLLATRRR